VGRGPSPGERERDRTRPWRIWKAGPAAESSQNDSEIGVVLIVAPEGAGVSPRAGSRRIGTARQHARDA
jgi:hypothetical protein